MQNKMTTQNNKQIEISPEEMALLNNDLSKLSTEQRSSLYMKICSSVGLNPLTSPFEYITLNGKLTFYAKRNCTDQLRTVHDVSVSITSREKTDDLYVVTAKATTPSGRTDESIGAVTLNGLKGDALANAIMKCETKAKRRVTLSICGLSILDETEVETIKDVRPIQQEAHQAQIKDVSGPASEPTPPRAQVSSQEPDRDPPPLPPHGKSSQGPTEKQLNRLVAIGLKNRWSVDAIGQASMKFTNKKPDHLNKEEYDRLCAYLEKNTLTLELSQKIKGSTGNIPNLAPVTTSSPLPGPGAHLPPNTQDFPVFDSDESLPF